MLPRNQNIIAFTAVVAGWAAFTHLYQARADEPVSTADHLAYNAAQIDRDIQFHEQRVKRDPTGPIGWRMLSAAYLVRASESDSTEAARKAEAAARRSLSLRQVSNAAAATTLVQALLAQHRFSEALTESENAIVLEPENPHAIQQHAEVLLEVGKYSEAKACIDARRSAFDTPTGRLVAARMLEIEGKPDIALRMIRQSLDEADASSGVDARTLAFFHGRLGTTLATAARWTEAETEFKADLALYPRDYRALAGLTRLYALESRTTDVLHYGAMTQEVAPMADVEGLLGDAELALGHHAKAEKHYATVAVLAGTPSGDAAGRMLTGSSTHGHRLDRQYAMFCADHHRDLDGAYAAALRDLQLRRDIYGLDTLAWVCYQRGEIHEADLASRQALSHGTQDPRLWLHAGIIQAKVGNAVEARRRLEMVKILDPSITTTLNQQASIALTALPISVMKGDSK